MKSNVRCLVSTSTRYTRAGLATVGPETWTEQMDGAKYHGMCRKHVL